MNEINPIVWCLVSVVDFKVWGFDKFRGRKRYQEQSFEIVVFSALIILAAKIICAAFLDSFGKSPYDHSLFGVLKNAFYIFPWLWVRESFRTRLLNWRKENSAFVFVMVIVITTVCEVNFVMIRNLASIEEMVVYLFETLLPIITEQTVLCYYCIYGGRITAYLFTVILSLFEWYFPILPVLNWLTATVLGVCLPVILCTYYISQMRREEIRGKKESDKSVSDWICMGICVLVIWFFAGVFPIYPSVVLTGSMEPGIMPGDIVLIDRFQTEEDIWQMQVGDILNYEQEEITITHRIVRIDKDEAGNLLFETKGDNNSKEDDELVTMDHAMGKIIGTVKKVGLPVLWLKGANSNVKENVEF